MIERGLALKRTGNLIMETVGGRAVHPVNVRVGGFYRAPEPAAIAALADPLKRAREAALATVRWVAGFDFPDVIGAYRFVALRQEGQYAIDGGARGRRTGWTSPRRSSRSSRSKSTWTLDRPAGPPRRTELSHRATRALRTERISLARDRATKRRARLDLARRA